MGKETAMDPLDSKKSHRERKTGRKAVKKKSKTTAPDETLTDKQRNPKAFAFNSAVRAERQFRRKQDKETKKQHIPLVDRTPIEPPPILVAVVGPPKVGKTTLIKNLIKLFTKSPLVEMKGPVTVVIGKKRRITFIECNNDINSMIDLAKVADLVLLLCDASFGFEMEVFEFLNICQVHGMPKIMGVLTHLDMIKNAKTLKNTKKVLKHRFWTEVYPGAKLFYLSGLIHEEYLRNEIKNLGRFISVMKFRPLTWRSTHGYLLGDRYEDLTNQELIRNNPKCDRNICLYGYVRGVAIKKASSVHVAGLGDLKIHDMSFLPDPCPLPEQLKKRALIEKEKLIYAPFSGVGGIVYDKDAVYVELGGSHSYAQREEEADNIVSNLIDAEETPALKMERAKIQVFNEGKQLGADLDESSEEENEASEEEMENADSEEDEEEEGGEEEEDKMENSDGEEEEEEDKIENSDNEEEEEEEKGAGEEEGSENEEIEETGTKHKKMKIKKFKEEGVKDSAGRLRRKVVFETSDEALDLADSDEEIEEEGVDEKAIWGEFALRENKDAAVRDKVAELFERLNQKKVEPVKEEESEEEEDGSEDDEDEGDEVRWKENLTEKAETAFRERQNSKQNLMKMIYGVFDTKKRLTSDVQNEDNANNSDDDATGGIFSSVSRQQQKLQLEKDKADVLRSSLRAPWDAPSRDWLDPQNKALIADCFVTGKWGPDEDAGELLKLDDAEDLSDADSEMFGDFEDLETGAKHTAVEDQKRKQPDDNDDLADRKALAEKKRKLKQQFDQEYDNNETSSYYDDLKMSAEKQAQLNKTAFENMPDDIRVQLEGFRPGMYVRIEFRGVAAEFIENFDPTYPLVVGALNMGEENIGFVNVKIKKHRWYGRILKTSDPLILSLGWRRFQTIPIFSKLEDDLKFRYLKYTPEHLGCNAHFWGPITPQGSGFLALQSVESNPEMVKKQGFKIAATGVVQELDKSTQIMKKLKLIGQPMKIYKKTAFIKGMFNSSLEVARFEGARLKTVSGIRGQIKKAINKPEGCFRATFEDKIKMSDLIFCRTWYKVDVPQFYNPVTTLLLPQDKKNQWRGARTTGQIKRDEGIKNPTNKNSLYTPVERKPRPFKPLQISRKLQQSLPYRDKPKNATQAGDKKTRPERVAVIREPQEEKVANMMKMLKATYKQKQEKLKAETKERMEKHQKMVAAQEAFKDKKLKQKKKEVFRSRSKAQKSNRT